VLTNVRAEISQNLAVLTPQIAAHRTWIQALTKADASQQSQSAFDILAAARPGDAANIAPLRHGAWDTVASGALRLLDYELAARLAEIYGAQTTTYDSLGRMVTSALYTTAMFDSSVRAEAIQVGRHVIDEVAGNETYLKGLYEKHLPALNDAIAEHQ
jgi:hypothetical protein